MEEKNVDEFNQLFKEVKWMKKALSNQMNEEGGDEDILLEDYASDQENDGEDEEVC